MTGEFTFRPYEPRDRDACLRLFDENCPVYFAANERSDYALFLDDAEGRYELCLVGDAVVGACGLFPDSVGRMALRWILLAPEVQGRGLGTAIMRRVVSELRQSGIATLRISASHKSVPFFARFGAREDATLLDGWGSGMHRVEMHLDP
ncbi:MAG: GNAT family N-acetyltransferase [Thermoanaerobaculia bacterium]